MTDRLLRSVIDSLEGRMCILSADGTILGTNRVWDDLATLLALPDVASRPGFFALMTALGVDEPEKLEDAIRSVLRGAARDAAVKGRWLRGNLVEHVVVRVHAVRDHEEERAVVTIVDITDAMRTQEELRRLSEQAELLALVAKHTDNAVVITDENFRIEWANEAFCNLTGYAVEESVGRLRHNLWHGPLPSQFMNQPLRDYAERGQAIDVEVPAQTKDGRSYWAHLQVQPIYVAGRIVKFVTIERDVTRRREVQEELRRTNDRVSALAEELRAEKSVLAGVLAAIPHLVYWKDRQLRYVGVNQAFLTTRNLSSEGHVVGRTELELALDDGLSDVLDQVERAVLTGAEPHVDRRVAITGNDGRRHDLLLNILPQHTPANESEDPGVVAGVIGVAADITHISELERQLAQASRLESIGQLAAGIAHEINTPVQYVSDNTQFIADTVSEVLNFIRNLNEMVVDSKAGDDPVALCHQIRQRLNEIDLEFLDAEVPSALSQSQEGLARVSEIVKAMKEFSHPGAGRSEIDINRAVASTTQVCRNEWRYVAEVNLELDATIPSVHCFEGELKQVILNIIVNAAQAIGGAPDRAANSPLGRIDVKTCHSEDYVYVIIGDNGPGMPESVKERIFDPFFTTKGVGKGTGQGLSMAYATIVSKHGGTLSVDSAPGEGSTFTIGLPRVAPEMTSA